MSPDLTRALHDAVDTGPDDAPFDVTSLTGRIRRRRTVRAGVRGGVTVGAVGAVALGAVYVQGRDPFSVLPAARADAAPGTCGSDIGLLPVGQPSRVGLLPFTDGSQMSEPAAVPAPGTGLGVLVGRYMHPVLVRELEPGALDAAVADLVATAETSLAAAEARRSRTLAEQRDTPLTAGQLDALDRSVEVARENVELARTSDPISDIPDERGSRVMITHDGIVVASEADPAAVRYTYSSSENRSLVTSLTSTKLSTCATDDEPGGDPLPAGEYAVYVDYADAGERVVSGPWPLTVLAMPPAPSGLPEGFPVDDVPLIGGRLVSATPFRDGQGWGLEIANDADDAATEAARLLDQDGGPIAMMAPPPGLPFPVAGWKVSVAASESSDGEPTVVYTVVRD